MGEDGACDVGTIRLQLGAGGATGITGWALRGVPSGPIDGLATIASDAPPRAPAPAHPNGAIGVDHVVVATPDLERTLAELAARGFDLRRTRDAGPHLRQAFYVIGDALLEVVGPPAAEPGTAGQPARFWGLTLVVDDLDAACARLGDLAGEPRDAVQPGRRIATVARAAGLGTPLALMTPRPRRR